MHVAGRGRTRPVDARAAAVARSQGCGARTLPSTPPATSRRPPRMGRRQPLPPPRCKKPAEDRKSTRLNSSHLVISYAVFCLKKKKIKKQQQCNEQTHKRRTVDAGVDD